MTSGASSLFSLVCLCLLFVFVMVCVDAVATLTVHCVHFSFIHLSDLVDQLI